jgi:hypothetical protein
VLQFAEEQSLLAELDRASVDSGGYALAEPTQDAVRQRWSLKIGEAYVHGSMAGGAAAAEGPPQIAVSHAEIETATLRVKGWLPSTTCGSASASEGLLSRIQSGNAEESTASSAVSRLSRANLAAHTDNAGSLAP